MASSSKKTIVLLIVFLTISMLSVQAQTKIIAHRGYWQTNGSAQNSLRSLEEAHRIGAYGAEFDVHLTSDNVLVIFHDDTIQGISIQDHPYSAIKDLTLSNGEPLPTLESYLQRSLTLPGIRLIFELKPHKTPERNREAARASVEMIRQMGLEDRTEYITFNNDAGLEFIRIAPQAQVAYLNGDLSPARLKELGYTGLDYNYKKMLQHPHWFKEARELGLTINVWTVNKPDLIRQLIHLGAGFITTDIPVEALSIVAHPSTN
ncbi:MAG: glycerophosphodiester phosphodiesterase [Tannerellaceae bacterium]|nr:glycerophosphodiester phosphodiesterase [Tannerellaceae bacterium]